MKTFALDANVLSFYFGRKDDCPEECCEDKPPNAKRIVSRIQSGATSIVFTPAIESEYSQTVAGNDYKQLWTAWLHDGRLEVVSDKDKLGCKKRLTKEFGMSSKDYKYANAAFQSTERLIISEDFDFWDPKMKTSTTHGYREGVKNSGNAAMKKELKKLGIDVLNLRNGSNEI